MPLLSEPKPPFRIGTAAWTIPAVAADRFPVVGGHLERYAERLQAVEINSSFYREHKAETYTRWGESVPESFRFAVKLSRAFTHTARLQVDPVALAESVARIAQLGKRFGVLLVQLPPSLRFQEKTVDSFFRTLRKCCEVPIVCEPRHASWLVPDARALLAMHHIGKVEADPEPCPWPESASAASGVLYLRLHGSPEMYRSDYDAQAIESSAVRLEQARERGVDAWCIFDNTTFGYATGNALDLAARLNVLTRLDADGRRGKMRTPRPERTL